MAASLGKLLLGEALLCAFSVVQDRAATSCVQRDISVFYGYRPFWEIDVLLFCLSISFEVVILPCLVVF